MYQSIKLFIRQTRTARVMRRLDREFFRLEVVATNVARSIQAYDHVQVYIENRPAG